MFTHNKIIVPILIGVAAFAMLHKKRKPLPLHQRLMKQAMQSIHECGKYMDMKSLHHLSQKLKKEIHRATA